ncbi:DUF1422 family protein, partial [Klebsiella pneumoniae]|uniref:DUF1422 family protein n=1 Tax=Klebsiella pneumoniae TaxID=573 RepID=UPI001CED1808
MKHSVQDKGTLLLALIAGLSINGAFAALFSSIVPFSVFPMIFLHQAADLFLRRAEVDALDIMARRHNTADAALIKVQHPLNHQSFLRIKQWMLILI